MKSPDPDSQSPRLPPKIAWLRRRLAALSAIKPDADPRQRARIRRLARLWVAWHARELEKNRAAQ